ncbi:MAG: NlpC/P60 family protein [bacterium]
MYHKQKSEKSLGLCRGFCSEKAYPAKSLRNFVSVWLIALSLFETGCLPVVPRFTRDHATQTTPATSSPKELEKPEQKQRTGESEGEKTEAVNLGERNFRNEKNSALSNLDQSKMMREISKYMGTPYQLGGEDLNGIDCSAYTMVIFKNAINKQLPRLSSGQYNIGEPVEYTDLKFGDLVFFNTTGSSASHVGIYLGDDLFAHASVSLGVTISSLQSYYYKQRYEGSRRIIE